MSIPELGILKEVPLREAWQHEARSFTPWLSEHLDQLSNVIGIPLELVGREVAVETFSADLLARNAADDSLVLIENQLEATDHNHLGQIMTYLAGLEAQTIIWIAADFRDAHLSAVRWLNDHTTENFAFFAIRVKVVRIANSPLAPVFEVLVKPNEWERQLQTIARDTQNLSELGQFRLDFWTHYVNRFPEEAKHEKVKGVSSRWRVVKECGLVISIYLAQKSVGIFIRGNSGESPQEVYEKLEPHLDYLTQTLGADPGKPDGKYSFGKYLKINTADKNNWDKMSDWLYQHSETYENALKEIGTTNGR